ncbi:MAG TPA: Fe-S cluster assembly protein SufD [Anaerolineaceae bacterium]|nr:Fe-S cluster assembly protein SufD [Anaerolineaceae bacterium]
MTESPVVIRRSRVSQEETSREFQFSPQLEGADSYFEQYRAEAWKNYQGMPFPTVKQEAWRRTDVSKMPVQSFRLEKGNTLSTVPGALLEPVADALHGGEILLAGEHHQLHLESELEEKGVVFTDLQNALVAHPQLVEKVLGKVIGSSDDKFGALAGAMSQNGVLLYVPRGVQVASPLHSLLWVAGQREAAFSHILVYLDDGSSVTYVHESSSPESETEPGFHSGLIEIHVGDGAHLRFVELQSFGENIWNFMHERVRVEGNGEVEWIFGAFGSKLTKNFSELDLAGTGSTGKMSGFYFSQHEQHLDYDTQQNHLAPHTTSDLLFKGALLDQSHSVWQGMIYVAKNAAKTDGYQANRNLVLSEGARADSIPGLEILTDDVRCTHGATVGKVDAEQLFYLESRGLSKEDAEMMIVEGFFDPIMQRIPFEGVKKRFQLAINQKMKQVVKS